MAENYTVRLLSAGPNKLAVVAKLQFLFDCSYEKCSAFAEAGNLVVLQTSNYAKAFPIARELAALGASVALESDGLPQSRAWYDSVIIGFTVRTLLPTAIMILLLVHATTRGGILRWDFWFPR